MNIVVCIKQVPDTADIKWTENNTIQREGVESVINPFDTYALETALRIKDKLSDCKVTAISMGPPQAVEMLKKTIAIGCDEAFLLSDRKFAGADTVATSRTLAGAIKEKCQNFDMIICGQFATDGDTAQTAPSMAQHLNLPSVTYVKEITTVKDGFAFVKREVEDGIEELKVQLPAIFCMLKCDYEIRRPYISGFIASHEKNIPIYTHEDINLNVEDVGLKGSPTYVSKAFRPEQKQGGEIKIPASSEEGAMLIAEKIKEWSK